MSAASRSVRLAQEVGELRLACLEVGGAEPQHPLNGGARVAQQLFAAFELLDRLAEAGGMRLELAATLREELLESLLRRSVPG